MEASMPARSWSSALFLPFDLVVAATTNWDTAIRAAREVRAIDGEWLDMCLVERNSGAPDAEAAPERVAPLLALIDRRGLDAKAIRNAYPSMMTALQAACLDCRERADCMKCLDNALPPEAFRSFCPNTARLDALSLMLAQARPRAVSANREDGRVNGCASGRGARGKRDPKPVPGFADRISGQAARLDG
jgi:hypothetical protein